LHNAKVDGLKICSFLFAFSFSQIADKEGNTRLLAESTPDLSGRHIDENFNAEALSTTSGSSIEPRSDCSLTDHEIGLDVGIKSIQ